MRENFVGPRRDGFITLVTWSVHFFSTFLYSRSTELRSLALPFICFCRKCPSFVSTKCNAANIRWHSVERRVWKIKFEREHVFLRCIHVRAIRDSTYYIHTNCDQPGEYRVYLFTIGTNMCIYMYIYVEDMIHFRVAVVSDRSAWGRIYI